MGVQRPCIQDGPECDRLLLSLCDRVAGCLLEDAGMLDLSASLNTSGSLCQMQTRSTPLGHSKLPFIGLRELLRDNKPESSAPYPPLVPERPPLNVSWVIFAARVVVLEQKAVTDCSGHRVVL